MENFSYVGLDKEGHKKHGVMLAANEVDLEIRLKRMNVDLTYSRNKKSAKSSFLDNISIQELIIFCVQIEQLERAGVPLLDSLSDLRDSTNNNYMKNIMTEVYENVKNGELLSSALKKHPLVFDNIFVSLVKVGEKTGNLHEVFGHLSDHLKWVEEIRRKVKKATMYPLFLLFLMSGILSLMMLFVIPKLSDFLTSQSFDLPLYTRALINFSSFFSNYWYAIIIFIILSVIGTKLAVKTSPKFALQFDKLKLKIPILGKILRKIELSRFCHFFALMYKSGIGIIECIEISATTVKNKDIKKTIDSIKEAVGDGASLAESIKISDQFPSLVVRMFKIGENGGNLDVTLDNVNFFYKKEVDDGVNNLVGVLQPLLTIMMGGLMLWISLAVFGPLYNSFSQMNF